MAWPGSLHMANCWEVEEVEVCRGKRMMAPQPHSSIQIHIQASALAMSRCYQSQSYGSLYIPTALTGSD